ncbi:YczE/YyaS/YitT family protein [Enterococcus crotali]|uniref:YczE/YyaS/YitT family protein n=1 Tax=Enterococcus crotali TaxID=1453587 RepID=UPI00046F48FC|nr:YitT family protein [Enterococcus crotali]
MKGNTKIRELAIRSLYALIGVAILAFGAATLRIGQVGLDPYTAANIGIGSVLNLSLGVYQLLINLAILVLVFIFGRQYIGIGTVINMVLAGFFIDFYTWVYTSFFTIKLNLFSQSLLLIFGVLIFTFGASFYMSAKVGNAPYDAIAPIIVKHTGAQYRLVRVVQDIIFVIIAFIFGGPVGIGTVINAFFTGPFIDFWNKKVCQPLIEKSIAK